MLWHVVDQLGHSKLEDETSLSRRLIERAITRAAHDPSTRFSEIPYGITPAEMRAVRFDAACPFCQYEDEIGRAGDESDDRGESDDDDDDGDHDHEGEACPLCDEMAKEWRAKHAAQLRRAGLAPAAPAAKRS